MIEKDIEERLEKIIEMMKKASNYTENFLDNLDFDIPEEAKQAIIDIVNSDDIKNVLDGVKTRRPPRIVIMGRSGVGKSSLINAMFGAYLAETSAVEVGTIDHDIFQYKKNGKLIFEIIDTRGIKENLKASDNSAEDDLQTVIEEFQPDAFLFLTNGADRSALREDAVGVRDIFDKMQVKPPLITVITRVDALEPARIKEASAYTDRKKANIAQKEEQVKRVLQNVGLADAFIVPVSAYIEWSHEDPESLSIEERENVTIAFDGRYNIDALFEILEDNIDINAAIDLMFHYKMDKALEKIANKFVKAFSKASLFIGASPIPVADILILLPIQVVEVVLIGYLGGKEIDAKAAREFIVSLGAVFIFGFGLRFAAQQGTKLLNVVPGAGSAISGSVAYSGTYSIGQAAISYYIKDMSLNEAKKEAGIATKETEIPEDEPIEIELEDVESEKGRKWKVNLNADKAKETWRKIKGKWSRDKE